MSELIALFRLSISCSRLALVSLGLIAVTLLSSVMIGGNYFFGNDGLELVQFAAVQIFFFLGIAGIGLFHFGNQADMRSAESGCSDWLLRMPVDSWKIAIIPVTLKSVWTAVFLSICIYLFNDFAGIDRSVPYLAPIVAVSATSIWLMMLAWRPFQNGPRRMTSLLVSCLLLYFVCIGALLASPSEANALPPMIIKGSQLLPLVVYALAVMLTIRTVNLARTNINGMVPEVVRFQNVERSARSRYYTSDVHALAHHDWLSSKEWIAKTCLIGLLPSIILLSFVQPLVLSVVVGFVLFLFFAGWSIIRIGANPDGSLRLPSYLATKPIGSATIAWTRLTVCTVIMIGIYCCIGFLFALLVLWPENREAWLQWAANLPAETSTSNSVSVGFRLSAAVFIATGALVIGRIVSYFWTSSSGRPWLSTTIVVSQGVAFLIAVMILTRWVQQQPDWETAKASAISWATWLPSIATGLLIAKGIAVASASLAVTRFQRASPIAVVKLTAIWTVIVLMIGSSLAVLIPYRQATMLACIVFAALAIPLSRTIILPLCLAWNRHR